ncbi:hypothetical protein MNV49_001921 [Pseudohyphozyma bogoriensis]|nr:hypothetical protein MNV49_001921 [Pseudohyphozyma bogoriensis]
MPSTSTDLPPSVLISISRVDNGSTTLGEQQRLDDSNSVQPTLHEAGLSEIEYIGKLPVRDPAALHDHLASIVRKHGPPKRTLEKVAMAELEEHASEYATCVEEAAEKRAQVEALVAIAVSMERELEAKNVDVEGLIGVVRGSVEDSEMEDPLMFLEGADEEEYALLDVMEWE